MSDPRRFDGTALGIGHASRLVSQLDEGIVDLWVNPAAGLAISGTWTPGVDAVGVPQLARAAAAADEVAVIPVEAPSPFHYQGGGESGKVSAIGLKPMSLVVQYEVDTADADDVKFLLQKKSLGANGAAATLATLAGDVDADYDAAHNTAAERGLDTAAPELHTAEITIPTTEQALLLEGEQLQVRVEADAAGAGTSVITVKSARIRCRQVHTDVAPS